MKQLPKVTEPLGAEAGLEPRKFGSSSSVPKYS